MVGLFGGSGVEIVDEEVVCMSVSSDVTTVGEWLVVMSVDRDVAWLVNR